MSATTPPVAAPGAPFLVMLRGAFIPSAIAAVLAVIVVGVLRGGSGALSATFGGVVALAFFGSGLLLLGRLVRDANPMSFFAIAMTVYLGQVLGLLVVILLVRNAGWVDRQAMAIVIAVVTILWQAFAILAAKRAKILIFDVPLDRPTEDAQ